MEKRFDFFSVVGIGIAMSLIIICSVIFFQAGKKKGYYTGQIDAINGNVQYKAVTNINVSYKKIDNKIEFEVDTNE